MAMTEGRSTAEVMDGKTLVLPVAADIKIYDGCLVVLDADGNAKPATKAEGLTAVGRAEEYVDNTSGAAGDKKVTVRRGVFVWDNDPTTANAITKAHVLKTCYIVNENTVTSLATGSSAAGKVIAVESDGGIAVETL